ncbi:MAG: phosphatidylserine decarboxylase [Candidatus Hydrogenedentes bacterium]|nr:phosphatidylserine decarboxylase [Candidatus Hydrogenedentota bacterium]
MKKPFSAWREGLPVYLPCLAVGAAGAAAVWPHPVVAVPLFLLALGLFSLYFFRDPVRRVAAEPNEAVAPADGAVVGLEDLEDTPHYDGPCRRLSIFLSVLDVHINRAPVEGEVVDVSYRPGKFKNAMKAETSECNESNAVRMATGHGPVTVRQISGAVARRIVCRCGVGARLEKGQKFGMIKLGSRTELYLPPGTEFCVNLKDKVRAGSTVVARFP